MDEKKIELIEINGKFKLIADISVAGVNGKLRTEKMLQDFLIEEVEKLSDRKEALSK